ncbi:MAG: hypothetical protein KC912_11245 [Proteobacteria bacterium]|nr:hypothetical protein [Pseudomonadota bacterium]
MRTLLLGLALCAPATALAQGCVSAIGGAVGATRGHRDWDLATPSGTTLSSSPVLSMRCAGGGFWIGAEAVPGVRHSYANLSSRGSLMTTTHFGLDIRLADELRGGTHVVTNGAVVGIGGRLHAGPIEFRVDYLPGRDASAVAWLLLDIHPIDGGYDEGIDFGWDEVDLVLRHGFEVGHFTGYRVEIGPEGQGPLLGARVGAVSGRRSKVAAQPTAFAFMDIPLSFEGTLSLEASAGGTLRHGELQPAAGLRLVGDFEDAPIQVHGGWMFGLGDAKERTPDVGIGFIW